MINKIWLLKITEYNVVYDPSDGVAAAYSTHPTKKQLVSKFKELGVKNAYEMLVTGDGNINCETWIAYKLESIELL